MPPFHVISAIYFFVFYLSKHLDYFCYNIFAGKTSYAISWQQQESF